jgi:Protein of unknown function (DUF2490)
MPHWGERPGSTAVQPRTDLARILLLAALCPLAVAGAGRATEHNGHAWMTYFGDHPIAGSRWGVHLEGQSRRHDFGGTWQQLLLRPGVNFQATRGLTLTGGYAFVRSHAYSHYATAAPALNEHRIWEQAWLRYRSGRIRWGTRLRFENRFVGVRDVPGKSSYRFENRVRAFQQVTVPVSQRVYLTAYDEFWFYAKPYVSNSIFDQNRAYAGVGFHLRPSLRFEAAYMNQTLLHRSGRALEQNHTMMFSLFSTASFFKR